MIIVDDDGTVEVRLHNRVQAAQSSGGEVLLPPGTALWMTPDPEGERHLFDELGPGGPPQHFASVRLEPGLRFAVGKAHFVVDGHAPIAGR